VQRYPYPGQDAAYPAPPWSNAFVMPGVSSEASRAARVLKVAMTRSGAGSP
jgi:hypothetical protein